MKTYNVTLSHAGRINKVNFAIAARDLRDLIAKIAPMGYTPVRVASVEIA